MKFKAHKINVYGPNIVFSNTLIGRVSFHTLHLWSLRNNNVLNATSSILSSKSDTLK